MFFQESSGSQLIQTSDSFINTIAKCLSSAVGDDIKLDVSSHKLITHNSTPTRIWDLIHRNIYESFTDIDIIAKPTKRGPWQLLPVFDQRTGMIYTLMREERFKELQKHAPKRRSMHYVDALACSLNDDLIPLEGQLVLEPFRKKESEAIQTIISKIFFDLGVPNEVVKRHAIILFNSSRYDLMSLRCCIVDSNLDVVENADWNDYINPEISSVPDVLDGEEFSYIGANNGLKFRDKAIDKMGQTPAEKAKLKVVELKNENQK